MQFREIEFVSGLKDAAQVDNFRDDGFAYARLRARHDAPTLADALNMLASESRAQVVIIFNFKKNMAEAADEIRSIGTVIM